MVVQVLYSPSWCVGNTANKIESRTLMWIRKERGCYADRHVKVEVEVEERSAPQSRDVAGVYGVYAYNSASHVAHTLDTAYQTPKTGAIITY
jgi:hypothetical protein